MEWNPTSAAANFVASLSNLTIREGNRGTTAQSGGTAVAGGGLTCGGMNALYTITNCIFDNNQNTSNVAGNGGGIAQAAAATTGAGRMTLTNCIFRNNKVSAGVGGAYRFIGSTTGSGTESLTVTGCTFDNNEATTNEGGAMFLTGASATFNITKSTFINNKAVTTGTASSTGGGAIQKSNGTLTLNFCRIHGNTVGAGGAGSGVKLGGNGDIDATNNWWGGNTDPTLGGPGVDTAYKVPTVTGNLTVLPQLVLTHTANPAAICPNMATTLTASFLKNSANADIAVGNLTQFIGLPVTFNTAVLGALSGAQPSIQASGTATATYTSGVVAGAGTRMPRWIASPSRRISRFISRRLSPAAPRPA